MSVIQRVEAFPVAYPEPNDGGARRCLALVRIETNDGVVGWGEGVTMFPEATRAVTALVDGMAQYVLGRDPLENIAIWRAIKERTWWYGHGGGLASFALSAIDIALWDVKGRLLGQPLLNLIGGPAVERLPAIASTHAFGTLEDEVARHGRYVNNDGYRGVKVGFGKRGETNLGVDLERDLLFVRLLRDAIGPNALLMIDRGQSLRWTLTDIIRRLDGFELAGLTWIEEPFEPHAQSSFRALRMRANCLIAGGEREWDVHGYERVIRAGAVDVVGCDVGRVEGVTGVLQITRLIENAGVWFNSHAWSSAINTAAAIALSASTASTLVQELKPDENPMQHELVANPISQKDGWIEPLAGPGLGVDVDERVVARYRLTA